MGRSTTGACCGVEVQAASTASGNNTNRELFFVMLI
jgi:hypothetical protein